MNQTATKLMVECDNYELIQELKKRGLVVICFDAADVLNGQGIDDEHHTPELLDRAWEWIVANGDHMEEKMAQAGNDYIGFADAIT